MVNSSVFDYMTDSVLIRFAIGLHFKIGCICLQPLSYVVTVINTSCLDVNVVFPAFTC